MDKRIENYIKYITYFAISIFIICWVTTNPEDFKDILRQMGTAASVTIIFAGIYSKWLWRKNPFDKTPKLLKKYIGKIEYKFNNEFGEKSTEIYISQNLFSISVRMKTDEVESTSLASKLVEENDRYVLYYTYITNPKSKYSEENPIQYGTCRIVVNNPKRLEGVYWTTSKTKGDIYWEGDCADDNKH